MKNNQCYFFKNLPPLPESFRDPEGETSDSRSNQHQFRTPPFGGGGGGQNDKVLKYDIILSFLLNQN